MNERYRNAALLLYEGGSNRIYYTLVFLIIHLKNLHLHNDLESPLHSSSRLVPTVLWCPKETMSASEYPFYSYDGTEYYYSTEY